MYGNLSSARRMCLSTRLKRRPHNGRIKWNITAAVTGRWAGSPSHWAPPTDPSLCVCAAVAASRPFVLCVFFPSPSPQHGAQRSTGQQPGTNPPLAGTVASSTASVNQDSMETDWHRQADSRESVTGGAKRKLNAGSWGWCQRPVGKKRNNSGVKECVGKCEREFCKGGCCNEWRDVEIGLRAKSGSLWSRVCVVCWRRCASSLYLHTAVSWMAPQCERTH